MFSQVHTKTRNRLTYKKLNLIVYLRYNQKLKLRSLGRRSQKQLIDSFTPIDLENIFDDSDPINLWLSEKERPVFEGDDLHWLDVDGQEEDDIMNIDDDDDRQLGVSPPFRYSVDQQSQGTHNSGSGDDLSPPSTADGSGDGGNGGNQGVNATGTSQSSRPSSRDINPNMFDHNSRRSEEYEEETIAHTYRRLRKAKDKASKAPSDYDNQVAHGCPDEQQMPSTFTAAVNCNWSCDSDSYDTGSYNYGYDQTNADWGTFSDQSYPSYPGSEPHLPQSNPSSQTHDNFQVFNHGTINYGDHHYYRPTIHAADLSSSGPSWMDATSSYLFQQQGTDRGYMEHQNEETNYQEPARRSFWW